MGYSRKNQTQWLRIYFSEYPAGNILFRFVTLTLIFGESKLSPLKIMQNCMKPLRNSKVKNQDPWKFHTTVKRGYFDRIGGVTLIGHGFYENFLFRA